MVLKKVGILSVGKSIGAIFALISTIYSAVFLLLAISINQSRLVSLDPRLDNMDISRGPETLLMLIFLPVFLGMIGFIVGIIIAVGFNMSATMSGGIEFEFEKDGSE